MADADATHDRATYYREVAVRYRLLAQCAPLSVTHYLRSLAREYDEIADDLEKSPRRHATV